jgi:uncharacterized protein (DUF1330 family)
LSTGPIVLAGSGAAQISMSSATDDERHADATATHRWQDGVVTAYWISVYREIVDEAKVAAYGKLAGPALVAAGGTFLARGLPEHVYEAGEQTRTVLIEFESVEAAIKAHDSDAYAAALAALDGGAVRDLRIVAGVE